MHEHIVTEGESGHDTTETVGVRHLHAMGKPRVSDKDHKLAVKVKEVLHGFHKGCSLLKTSLNGKILDLCRL